MKKEFPIFSSHPDLIYLDSAATAQKPSCVIERMQKFYEKEYGTVHRAIYEQARLATDAYAEAREEVAKFLGNVSFDEVIFTKGTTDSINLVASSLALSGLGPDDEILCSEMEHHSNLVPWQMAALRSKAKLSFIPMDLQGNLLWEGKISSRTKIVAISHMSNVTGTIQPIQEIVKKAKEHGALVLVDGAQAAASIPLNLKALGVDFYAFSSHKCYGPTGIGVLYGKKELLEKMIPPQGGGDMILEVLLEKTEYAKPPLRFEAGTPAIVEAIGFKEALSWMKRQKEDFFEEHGKKLRILLEKELVNIPGLKILGTSQEKGPITTFSIQGIHPLDLATYLDLKKIAVRSGHLCAQPTLRKWNLSSALRVSFGAYNEEEEISCFMKALLEGITLLKKG